MPQNKPSSKPPEVSSRWSSAPVFAAFVILDVLRAFFQFFWFLGPAVAAIACTAGVNSFFGTGIADTAGKLVASGCTIAGVAGGAAASGFTTPLGIIVADAIGFISFLSLKLWMNSPRMHKVHKNTTLWQMGSFLLSELPFLGAFPVYSIFVWISVGRAIQMEKKELKKWEDATAAARQKQQAQMMQAEAIGQARTEQDAAMRKQEEFEAEEAANETLPASVPEFGSASVKTSPSPQLATVPNYVRTVQPLSEERYQKFASAEKARWAEQGANPLTEATSARHFAEINLESEQQSIEKYREKVENLRSDIDEKKSSLIGRILDFRQIQILERDLRAAERVQSSAEKMVGSRGELFTAYDRIVSEQQELGALMEEANKENTAWDERKRVEFIEEEKKRDVGNLARTHNTYFVHDIVDAEWKPSANNQAINTKNLNWNDQLDILMGLHPTISVSTIDQGSEQRTFGGKGSWGVFISGGRALGGGRSDIGSVAVGLRDRRFTSRNDVGVDAIEKAISGRDKNESYNELIVERPEIAGVYVRWNKSMPPLAEEVIMPNRYTDSDGNTYGYDSWWKSMQDVIDRNVPIFVMDINNQAHLIHDINVEKRSFKVAAALKPEDIMNMPGIYKQHIGSNEEKAAVGRVFDSVSHLLTDEEKRRFAPVPDYTGEAENDAQYAQKKAA